MQQQAIEMPVKSPRSTSRKEALASMEAHYHFLWAEAARKAQAKRDASWTKLMTSRKKPYLYAMEGGQELRNSKLLEVEPLELMMDEVRGYLNSEAKSVIAYYNHLELSRVQWMYLTGILKERQGKVFLDLSFKGSDTGFLWRGIKISELYPEMRQAQMELRKEYSEGEWNGIPLLRIIERAKELGME